MLIADRQTLAGLYPYMLWTTPGNQETKVMFIADRQTLAGLYPYMLWTKHWLGSTPTRESGDQGHAHS